VETPALDDLGNYTLFGTDSADGRVESDAAWRRVPGPPWTPAVPPFAAVDFETYYAGRYNLKDTPLWEYVTSSAFNAYLVALERWDGREWWRWVGHPALAPWADVAALGRWVSHSAVFDELVYRRLESLGVIPRGRRPEHWNCTAELAAYFQLDRGLDRVAPELLGEAANKSVRAKARAAGAGGAELRDYAGTDGRQCAWIWAGWSPAWPEREQYLARVQRRAGYRGIWLDQPLMARARARMQAVQLEVLAQVPWSHRHPVTSITGVRVECARLGIPPPPSLSLDEPETLPWVRQFGKQAPWLEALRRYTKARQFEAHVVTLQSRLRRDGTVPFELIYRKAPHTARWQHGGRLRIQNLDRDPFEGFHIRHFYHARPGCRLLVADSAQIEPRVLRWQAGDRAFLDAVRRGLHPYEVHARRYMGYADPAPLKKTHPDQYALAKARELALGYQAAAEKFCAMAWTYCELVIFEEERSLSPDLKTFVRESELKGRDVTGWYAFPSGRSAVSDFRAKSPLLTDKRTGLWQRCEDAMRRDVGGDHVVELPNGERILYFDVKERPASNPRYAPELWAWVVRHSRNPKHHSDFYGGKLTENRVQRIARELLCHFTVECQPLERFGYRLLWTSHDEIVAEAPEREAAHLLQAMLEIMSTSPGWAADLPLAADGQVADHYFK
jgi:DNA polymerase